MLPAWVVVVEFKPFATGWSCECGSEREQLGMRVRGKREMGVL